MQVFFDGVLMLAPTYMKFTPEMKAAIDIMAMKNKTTNIKLIRRLIEKEYRSNYLINLTNKEKKEFMALVKNYKLL